LLAGAGRPLTLDDVVQNIPDRHAAVCHLAAPDAPATTRDASAFYGDSLATVNQMIVNHLRSNRSQDSR
jgi:hypothetical protein